MPLRAFIVEDSATIRENLVAALEEHASMVFVGYAETELEACAWLADNAGAWDLAIVDLFLRDGNGLGVLQSLRDRDSRYKVAVVSNYATPEIKRRCLQFNADVVFDKSQEIDLLFDYCEELARAAG